MAATPNLVIVRAAGRIIHKAGEKVGEVVTVTGAGVLVAGVLAWVAGWLLGWQELMVVAASCLMAFAIGALFTVGRLGVDVTTALVPDRVVVGHPARARVMVRNASGRRVFPLTVEVTVDQGGRSRPRSRQGRRARDESFAVPTDRRAVIEVGPARSLRSDPLHLVRRSVVWPRVRRLYVHPPTVALDRFWAGAQRDLEGHSTDDTSANDVELHTLRDYVPGDDRRLVHWRTSARTGRLMVRQTVDTRQSHIALLLSGRGEDYVSEVEFETAVSCLASLSVRAIRDQHPTTVLAAGRVLVTASPRALLDGVSGVVLTATASSLGDAARRVARSVGGVSVAVLVTGAGTPISGLRAAAARFGPAVQVVAVRVDSGGRPGVRPVGAMPVLTVRTLDDLPSLLRLADRR
jgi:uncharacterized protein (DUF58 family)